MGKSHTVLTSIYSLLSAIFAWATEEHTQELKNTIIQKLDMVSARVSELIDEKIELDVIPKIFTAYLYLSPEPGQITDHEYSWFDQTKLKGERLGIHYKDEQPVLRVMWLSTEDPEHISWQDHGLPAELCDLLGIERGSHAPNYMPLEMFANLKECDTLVLEPKPGIEIHLDIWQGADKKDKRFEDTLPDVCRATFQNFHAMANRPGGSTHIEKYYLALCYLFGFGTPANEDAANYWLHVAADEGNHRAQVRLGTW